jgi:hypothetical protein
MSVGPRSIKFALAALTKELRAEFRQEFKLDRRRFMCDIRQKG